VGATLSAWGTVPNGSTAISRVMLPRSRRCFQSVLLPWGKIEVGDLNLPTRSRVLARYQARDAALYRLHLFVRSPQ
jgi:hypothetical protein